MFLTVGETQATPFSQFDALCLCDLKVSLCDVGCCCDVVSLVACPASGNMARKQCFLVCPASGNMARKQCFLVCPASGNMARKQCFLVCPASGNMARKQCFWFNDLQET